MASVRFGLKIRSMLVMALIGVVLALTTAMLIGRQASVRWEARTLSGAMLHDLFERNLGSRGEALARNLAEKLVAPMQSMNYNQINAVIHEATQGQIVSYVLVYDAQGRLLHNGLENGLGQGQWMRDRFASAALSADGVVTQSDNTVLEVAVPIRSGSQRIGGVRVGMSKSMIQRLDQQANLELAKRLTHAGSRGRSYLLVLVMMLLAVGVALVIYVQRTLVAPVRALAAAARQIEQGDYQIRLKEPTRNDEIGELIQAFIRMSRSIARHDREVRRLAYTDALTGLANRLSFRERLDQALAAVRDEGTQLALLFADIDDFKRVNDTLGHEAGDQALLQFAGRIDRAVVAFGGQHAELARFGGDEFAILIRAKDVSILAGQLAERLVIDLRQPLRMHQREIFLGTSIGITQYPDDAVSASTLLKNADIAMYQAKFSGKNCYRFYSRAMDHAVERRVQMDHELHGAWERGELHLVYQPIYRMSDRTLVGVEVLLRWQHPTLGTIPPSTFIEVAEQGGMIEKIGPKVLRLACMEAASWPMTHPPLFISVNVSSRQLRDGDLVRTVAQSLTDSKLSAARLHLELTETAVIGDQLQAARLLDELHRTGVKVWLDDFCTGFSGLSHLRQVPVDGVKIDKSFVVDLQRDPDDLALTTAIIAMAHSLGITVIAEGIEQESQFDLLRARSCDLGQGYWFSRPLRSSDMFAFLAGGQTDLVQRS